MSSGPAALLAELLPLVQPLLGVLVRTTAGALVLVIALAGLTVPFVGGALQMLVLLLVELALGGVFWFAVASQTTILRLVSSAVARLGLGRRLVEALFARTVVKSVADVAARLPLREWEQRLTETARSLLISPAPPAAGLFTRLKRGVARAAYRRAVELVTKVTLAELRESEGDVTGIDGARVAASLSARIDGMVVDLAAAQIRRVVVTAAIVLAMLDLLAWLAVRRFV